MKWTDLEDLYPVVLNCQVLSADYVRTSTDGSFLIGAHFCARAGCIGVIKVRPNQKRRDDTSATLQRSCLFSRPVLLVSPFSDIDCELSIDKHVFHLANSKFLPTFY